MFYLKTVGISGALISKLLGGIARADFPYAKVPRFDRELEDGEIFEIGNVKFRFVLTPVILPAF